MNKKSISIQLITFFAIIALIQVTYIKIDQNLFQVNHLKKSLQDITLNIDKKGLNPIQQSQDPPNYSVEHPKQQDIFENNSRKNGRQMNMTKKISQQRILTSIIIEQNSLNPSEFQNKNSTNQSIVNVNNSISSSTSSGSTFGDFNNLFIPSLTDLNNLSSQTGISTQINSTQSIFSPIITSNPANLLNQINYQNKDFQNIKLYSQIPTTLVEGQFILVKGQISNLSVTNSNSNSASNFNFIFICTLTGNKFFFKSSLFDTNKFKIQVQIPSTGNYQISMFLGATGNVSTTIYKVISNLPTNLVFDNHTNSNRSNSLKNGQLYNMSIINNDLYIQFSSSNFQYLLKDSTKKIYPIYRLQFVQEPISITSLSLYNISNQSLVPIQKVVLYLTNFNDSTDMFLIPYPKFANFTNTLTTLNVSLGISQTTSISGAQIFYSFYQQEQFEAIQHQFMEINDNLLAFYQTPPCYLTTGQDMKVKGQALSPLKNSMVVLSPNKQFLQYPLDNLLQSNQTLSINSQVNLTFLLDNQGTYIVEINHVNGYAVLNQPVYVGKNKYPLYPDFNDLNNPSNRVNNLILYDLEKQRLNFLNLINQKRRQFNQSDLYLDEQLNALAQTHTDDMVNRNYVSHTTPEGLGPSQRASLLGFYSQLSQNIGVNRNITDAHYRFCRSNIHLRNIVNSDWTRIGLGLKLGSNNNYYITQQFSIRDLVNFPFTDSQISQMQDNILNFFINASYYLKSQNKNLSMTLKKFQNNLISNPNTNLGDSLKQYSRWTYTSLSISYTKNYMNVMKQQIGILPTSANYNQIGMSILYKNGLLVMYFAFVS